MLRLSVIVVLFKAPLYSTLIPQIFLYIKYEYVCIYIYLIDPGKVRGL